jgi:hypothetical protein
MNDNTVLRIKVPAHLYESVKKQLTLKESKKKLSEAISGTDEELVDFYLRVKKMEAEETDLQSAVHYARFDIENPDAAKELSSPMTEAAKGKAHYGAGMEVVKEKKMKTTKDSMQNVEEVKDVDTKKKPYSLEELKAVKEKLEKKIHEMENNPKVEEKEKVDEYVGINPQDYDWITALGLSLPAIVAMLRLGADKLGQEVYDKLQKAKDFLSKKGSEEPVGEAKKKVEKAIYDDEDDSEDPLYLELVDKLGEKILHKLFDQGWDIDDIAADPQGAAASLKRK